MTVLTQTCILRSTESDFGTDTAETPCRAQPLVSTRCKTQSKMLRKRKSGKWSFQNVSISAANVTSPALLNSTLER